MAMTTELTGTAPPSERALDVERIRGDFPILGIRPRGKPLIYLDSAATSQKPRQVIDALSRYYEEENGNIHRGVHYLSELATHRYDETREAVRRFINAASHNEIVFTRNTTESINLLATTFGQALVKPGDEIIVSVMEHHSNIVPWQLMAERQGAMVKAVPVTDIGELDLDALESLIGPKTRLVALTWVSNSVGTVNPARRIVEIAHAKGVPVLLDGAQAAPHIPIDVQAVGCDFLAFSGHKMLGPTGVGVLYARGDWFDRLPPYQGGGGMIETVTIEKTTYAKGPSKYEAGTPAIGPVVAFRAAIEYLEQVGLEAISQHEHTLLTEATARVSSLPGIRLVGTAPNKASVLSFTMEGVHPHDISTILDQQGIAIRAGHHCTQPLMARYACGATARASFYLYNTMDEVSALVSGLERVREVFG
jgi:cysteine desulfurase/selenocysteine lyase